MAPWRPEYDGELAQGGERAWNNGDHRTGRELLRGQEVIEIRVQVEG